MKRKMIIAVTGASGAAYTRLLFQKIAGLSDELEEVAVIFTAKASEI